MQSPKQTPDSGLGDSSQNLEIKSKKNFPYSNHEFPQTCHFLCSDGGFHNAPSISPSGGLLTKQETSHHFKVTAKLLRLLWSSFWRGCDRASASTSWEHFSPTTNLCCSNSLPWYLDSNSSLTTTRSLVHCPYCFFPSTAIPSLTLN